MGARRDFVFKELHVRKVLSSLLVSMLCQVWGDFCKISNNEAAAFSKKRCMRFSFSLSLLFHCFIMFHLAHVKKNVSLSFLRA